MKTILFLLSGLGLATFALNASQPISTLTMTNLQAAFNGESNAHARYLAFANKADTEGYAGVASLFRAAARAEEIHAGNHAAVIKKFGGVPEAKLEDPVVKSTRENLEAAIKGETYERDKMYPAFIGQARTEANAEAMRTFTFAQAAEVEHAKLYTEALQRPGKHAGQSRVLRMSGLWFHHAEAEFLSVVQLAPLPRSVSSR